jgi:asparagine synthase (glutamine-hydrolysing)
MPGVWAVGWPAARVRQATGRDAAVVVVGHCGARPGELDAALDDVRADRWRALTRWPGSYLVVATHGPRMVVIGDLAGRHPVYWRPGDGGVWWATTALPLADSVQAGPDPVALAARFTLGQPDVLGTRSLFDRVRRVPTGHLLLIDPAGAGTAPYEPADHPGLDMRAGAPAVAAALTDAVAARLDGRPVVADLAGLDSTTLVCLAAARGTEVSALTHADPRMRDDDLAYAQRTAAAVPGLTHHVIRGSDETVMYADLDTPDPGPPPDEPSLYTATAVIKRAMLRPVADRHRDGVYVTGEGGDVVLSAATSYLADLYRTGRRGDAWRHTIAHARVRRTAPLVLWRRVVAAARGGVAGAWRRTATALLAAPQPPAAYLQPAATRLGLPPCAQWMAPELRRELADHLRAAARTLTHEPSLATWEDRQDAARIGADLAGWQAITRDAGLDELAAPYLDNEVIRACLAVRPDQRGTADRYKPLLSAAFPAGPVPDFVLRRRTKGGLDGVSHAGLRRHAGVILDLLGPSSRLARLGLASPQAVREHLRLLLAGHAVGQAAVHQAVVTELWLRRAEAGHPWWTVPASREERDRAAA